MGKMGKLGKKKRCLSFETPRHIPMERIGVGVSLKRDTKKRNKKKFISRKGAGARSKDERKLNW